MNPTETFPHRVISNAGVLRDCQCPAVAPVIRPSRRDGETWGSDCPAALREALEAARRERDAERALADDFRWQRDAAHDQLADIAALVAGELPPDDREGGDPVLGRAWEAVKSQREALVRECEAHTRCMGERDALRACVAELEATLAKGRAAWVDMREDVLRNEMAPGGTIEINDVLGKIDEYMPDACTAPAPEALAARSAGGGGS